MYDFPFDVWDILILAGGGACFLAAGIYAVIRMTGDDK